MTTQPLRALDEPHEALVRSRADARAARDEALRLASENEALRALLDGRVAAEEASRGGERGVLAAPGQPVNRGESEDLDRVRLEARLARSEAEALRDELAHARADAAAMKRRTDATTEDLARQLAEAHAESARAAAESREIHARIDHLLAQATRLRGG